jgi:hypothetical protein
MANQMIALQTRGPKLADPAAQTAKFVGMMNMTKQQEAAERQAALAQQSMVLAQKKDAREEALQGPAVTKAEIDNIRAQIDDLEEQYKMVSTEEGHQFWLGRVRKIDPVIADQIGMYAPNFDREKVNNIMLTAKQAVDKIDPDAKATVEYAGKGGVDEQGRVIPEGTGIQVITGSKPSTKVIPSAAAPASAPAAAPRTPVVPTGDGGQLDAFQEDHVRRMKEGLGMTDTPASFTRGGMSTPTAGQMTPDMVPAILDSAINTGVMAQIDLDQMLAMTPPQARDGIMKVIRDSKIALQADAPSLAASGMGQRPPMAANPVQTPQSTYANLPPRQSQDNTSMMQNTMLQYQPLQSRNREVSPIPGIYSVPTGQVAATSQAQRSSPKEDAAKEAAKLQAAEDFEARNKDVRIQRKREEVFASKRAEKDAEFLETYTDTVSKSRNTLNALDQMIGDARIERDRIVIPKGGRRPHGGFEGVVGAGIPGVRFIQGTQAAGFDALLEQVQGGAFLKAFNDLRGGGAITQPEGEKATIALTRVNRAQSEIEFVKAAREFVEILRNGIKNADKRYTRLTGEAPEAAPTQRKTPTSKLSPATRAKYGL